MEEENHIAKGLLYKSSVTDRIKVNFTGIAFLQINPCAVLLMAELFFSSSYRLFMFWDVFLPAEKNINTGQHLITLVTFVFYKSEGLFVLSTKEQVISLSQCIR